MSTTLCFVAHATLTTAETHRTCAPASAVFGLRNDVRYATTSVLRQRSSFMRYGLPSANLRGARESCPAACSSVTMRDFLAVQKSRRVAIAYAFSFSLLVAASYVTLRRQMRADGAPVHAVTVERTLPHDRNAFTQGLAYRDSDRFFESTGRYGSSSARVVSFSTGAVERGTPLPTDEFGEGIAVVDIAGAPRYVVQVLWKTGRGYVYDAGTLQRLSSFDLGLRDAWGIVFDPVRSVLYVSDGHSDLHLYTVRTTGDDRVLTFEYYHELRVRDGDAPLGLLNELELVRGELWANVLLADFIARIDPDSGVVRGWLDMRGVLKKADVPRGHQVDVLNGIVYHAEEDRAYITGKYWPKMYAVRCDESRVVSQRGVRAICNAFFLNPAEVAYIHKYVIG